MADDLTNAQTELLCEIGEHDLLTLTDDKQRDLEQLLSGGYVKRMEGNPDSAFKLTVKGFSFLDERGVGLNEA